MHIYISLRATVCSLHSTELEKSNGVSPRVQSHIISLCCSVLQCNAVRCSVLQCLLECNS